MVSGFRSQGLFRVDGLRGLAFRDLGSLVWGFSPLGFRAFRAMV